MKELKTINTTLLLIFKDNKILLGEKKRGFAKGTFNGVGGKQEENESIYETMIRETQEEIDVTPLNAKMVANIDYININYKGEMVNINMSVFVCFNFKGLIKETDEIKPVWFETNSLPFDKMLPDDPIWFPKVLSSKNIKAKFVFGNDLSQIKSYEITEVQQL